MTNNNLNNNTDIKANTLRDYINLFKSNTLLIIIISVVFLLASTIYAIIAPDIYTATTTLKINAPQGNVLSQGFGDLSGFGNQGGDRFIANEIETINNSTIKEQVARTLVDSFKVSKDKDDFSLIFDKDYFDNNNTSLKSLGEIIGDLTDDVLITQKNGLDFIDISAESESPAEAALIANSFAKTYRDYNLAESRKQVTAIREFLGQQIEEKKKELHTAENQVAAYQIQKGGVELDKQAQQLVSKLADFESQKNMAKIEMSGSKETLEQLKSELQKKNPSVADFLDNKSSEPYLTKLQDQIANLKAQRDIALASSKTTRANDAIVDEYNSRIASLNDQLSRSMKEYRAQVLSSSPEDIKGLSQKIFEEEVKYQSLIAQSNSLSGVVNGYEQQFNQLPTRTLDLARLERQRQATENLYNALDSKYQEALLNEQATPGNVTVLRTAKAPGTPSEPNRIKIIIMGLFGGIAFAFGFVYIRNYFDKTIKTPEDIEGKNVNVLAWVPKIKDIGKRHGISELFVARNPDTIQSEAFKTMRTRIQYSPMAKDAKIFLITSSAPGEGKSLITSNLGASFALDHKKTVIIDCDLRKPRVHTIFDKEESPGFLNYFFGKSSYESIIRKTEVRNLDIISGGSIPPNPSEIIGSPRMKAFFVKLKNEYDVILIDSPPIMAVSDSEILSRLADVSVLVVSSDNTEVDWMEESVDLLKHEEGKFMGVLLNNFNYKSGYHAYYKYYGHYSNSDAKGKNFKIRKKAY